MKSKHELSKILVKNAEMKNDPDQSMIDKHL